MAAAVFAVLVVADLSASVEEAFEIFAVAVDGFVVVPAVVAGFHLFEAVVFPVEEYLRQVCQHFFADLDFAVAFADHLAAEPCFSVGSAGACSAAHFLAEVD